MWGQCQGLAGLDGLCPQGAPGTPFPLPCDVPSPPVHPRCLSPSQFPPPPHVYPSPLSPLSQAIPGLSQSSVSPVQPSLQAPPSHLSPVSSFPPGHRWPLSVPRTSTVTPVHIWLAPVPLVTPPPNPQSASVPPSPSQPLQSASVPVSPPRSIPSPSHSPPRPAACSTRARQQGARRPRSAPRPPAGPWGPHGQEPELRRPAPAVPPRSPGRQGASGPTWGAPAGAAGAGSGALVPAASSVEPGESSLLACSGDSPSLLLSSSKAKASADLGKLTWVPGGGRGGDGQGPALGRGDEPDGGRDGVSLVAGFRACAQLLQSWPWAKDVVLRELGRLPPSPAMHRGSAWLCPHGRGWWERGWCRLLACAVDRVTRERERGGVRRAWPVRGRGLSAGKWGWRRSGSAILPHRWTELGRGVLASPSPPAEHPNHKPTPRLGSCPQH